MKTLLFTISCITLLSLTSCEKEDMDKGLTGGGGKEDANIITKSTTEPAQKNEIVPDTTLKVDF